jgi:hypothetical protein
MAAVTSISTDDYEVRAEIDVGLVGQLGAAEPEIRAIIVPQRTGDMQGAIEPIRKSEALSALSGSTLVALAGGRSETFSKISELVGRVPCYEFDPGSRLENIPDVLASLIEQS